MWTFNINYVTRNNSYVQVLVNNAMRVSTIVTRSTSNVHETLRESETGSCT